MTTSGQPGHDPRAIPQPSFDPSIATQQCELLLIRHGRSADVVPGTPESADPPLHVIGVQQAAALAARLAAKSIDAVYSSHLRRAHDTALPLATQRGLSIGVFPDLEEVRLGDWGNGEFRRRAAVRDPEFMAWSLTGRWDGIPGAEGDDVFRRRVADVIDNLAAQHIGDTIAVVAHGGVISAYIAYLWGAHRTMVISVENTSVTSVRVGPGGPTVVTANDCHHLYDPVFGTPAL